MPSLATPGRVVLQGALCALLPFVLTGCTEFASPDDELLVGVPSLQGAAGAVALDSDMAGTNVGMDNADEPMAQGSAVSGDWSCLDTFNQDTTLVADPSITHILSMRVANLLGGLAQNVELKACASVDVLCASPTVENIQPDAMGFFNIPLADGFNGFLEVRAPGLFPTIVFLEQPMRNDRVEPYPVLMLPPEALGPLAAVSQAEIRPELAIIAVTVEDCAGFRAAGVTISNNVGGLSYYFENDLASTNATQTDAAGTGGFINVPPGDVVFTATLSDGAKLPSRRVSIRAGFLTVVGLAMRP